MAVLAGIYGDKKPSYEGCVLDTYEHNGYEDSDWYAIVWDEKMQSVIEVNYDTTRAGGGGWAEIDATEEILRKVYRYYKRNAREYFDTVLNEKEAKKISKGDNVKVVRGVKVPKGTVGNVFWVGTRYNYYSHRDEDRVGIESNGDRMFVPIEYVEVCDWQDRMTHGSDRKRKIRNAAVNSMPYWARDYFCGHRIKEF